MKNLILALVMLTSIPTFAAYVRMAECLGRTENNANVRAVLFVDKANDSQGIVAISIDRVTDAVSLTQVNWTSNPQGFPRFFNNNFDLDIVIDDRNVSTDDVLVGRDYVPQLQCRYTP
jgi:hypothetical protein